MKILITAFEPFGDNVLNSSWEVAKLLPDNKRTISSLHFYTIILKKIRQSCP